VRFWEIEKVFGVRGASASVSTESERRLLILEFCVFPVACAVPVAELVAFITPILIFENVG
jgi:hypothetical protein